jgi:hypothetical protein
MTQAVVASIPVESPYVPGWMENIVDKKITGFALNWLETFVDWLCMKLYCPYSSLYNRKMARIHIFNDNIVRLFDATQGGVARIESGFDWEFITLFQTRVYFAFDPHNHRMVFSRERKTNFVVIVDDPHRRSGWVQIIYHEIAKPGDPPPMEIRWEVNTNNKLADPPRYVVELPKDNR